MGQHSFNQDSYFPIINDGTLCSLCTETYILKTEKDSTVSPFSL